MPAVIHEITSSLVFQVQGSISDRTSREFRSRESRRSSLINYGLPDDPAHSGNEITTADAMSIVEPIWTATAEPANRIRRRASTIVRRAIAESHRTDRLESGAITGALPSQDSRTRGPSRQSIRSINHGGLSEQTGGSNRSTIALRRQFSSTWCTEDEVVMDGSRDGRPKGSVAKACSWLIPWICRRGLEVQL